MNKNLFPILALILLFMPLIGFSQETDVLYTLTLQETTISVYGENTTPPNHITVNPPGLTFLAGTVVTLTATNEFGYYDIGGGECYSYSLWFEEWQGDLTGTSKRATLIMDSDKSVMAMYSGMETPIGPCNGGSGTESGKVSIEPATISVYANTSFSLDVRVNTGSQNLAAFGMELDWISPQGEQIIYADTNKGIMGVETKAGNFLITTNADTPGKLVIAGFEISGVGPSDDLHLLTVHFMSGPKASSTPLDITVNSLVDSAYNDVGTPIGEGSNVTVLAVMKGDLNGDEIIDIVDALLIARYSVGMQPPKFIAPAGDVDCNGVINIVDALMVAQYSVGLEVAFCP